jgi:predicted cupin superfamily sugar epimerase
LVLFFKKEPLSSFAQAPRGTLMDLRDLTHTADAVCQALDLSPHPEGGHYRELWRDQPACGARGAGTSILFLLAEGEISHWHRVDAAEIWIWQAGAALRLEINDGNGYGRGITLGPNLAEGEMLQAVVPMGEWQQAASTGAWSLVGCVVAPAFTFTGFEMAPSGWSP